MHDSSSPATVNNLYFITLKLSQELRDSGSLAEIFDKREYCDEFIKAIIFFIEKGHFLLYGFVFLSDQIHLIINSEKEDLHFIIQRLKDRCAKETLVLMGKNLNSMDDQDNRKQQSLRKIFNIFLNEDESVFWNADDSYMNITLKETIEKISPITSDMIISHLADENRNYLHLGASAFTKIMMETI